MKKEIKKIRKKPCFFKTYRNDCECWDNWKKSNKINILKIAESLEKSDTFRNIIKQLLKIS